jgi:hypothetical protein
MIEIGVWRGDRAVRFLTHGEQLVEYVGFDLFEGMTDELHEKEGMAACFFQYMDKVQERLLSVSRPETIVSLIKGNTKQTLPEFTASCQNCYDFIFIDGGHSLDTIENDWKYASLALAPDGVCIFDDYYLENETIGCKFLIDNLNERQWEKDFFRGIEKTKEGHYITMVAITHALPVPEFVSYNNQFADLAQKLKSLPDTSPETIDSLVNSFDEWFWQFTRQVKPFIDNLSVSEMQCTKLETELATARTHHQKLETELATAGVQHQKLETELATAGVQHQKLEQDLLALTTDPFLKPIIGLRIRLGSSLENRLPKNLFNFLKTYYRKTK